MERNEMLKQITILDFMAVDLQLFLNTHPHDREALQKYNEVVTHADKLRCAYEKLAGPLCSYRSLGQDGWLWENEPWPWCEEYNFELC